MKTIDELDYAGIYLLRFGETYTYVGKSVCVRDRLYQHIDSFEKGTAAVKLQQAYDSFGVPEITVLLECHADNIDVLEAWFINAYRDENNLNTCILKNPFPDAPGPEIDRLLDEHSKLSYRNLSDRIYQLEEANDIQSTRIANYRNEISDLNMQRSNEEIAIDLDNRLEDLNSDLSYYKQALAEETAQNASLMKEIRYMKELPWWRKLFI